MSRYRAPEPTAQDARFVLRGLLLLAGLGALIGIGVSIVLGTSLAGGRGGERLETYRNADYGYEVRYPRGWTVEDGGPQSVRFVRDAGGTASSVSTPSVLVALNLMGDLCGEARIERSSIVVSGLSGEESVCYLSDSASCSPEPACRSEPVMIVRFFENAPGNPSFAVVGTTADEVDTVRRIVESFRFVP